ncbi:MAG: aldehyde dehydrogenase family protein [Myxococcales bacterium]|nr:aldehyde dehydrogenase family protein [Myxococcales bacterium]
MQSTFRGDWIGGVFAVGEGRRFASVDPTDERVVCEAVADVGAVDRAVAAARAAARGWRRAAKGDRIAALQTVRARVPDHAEGIAAAITAEMGKPIAEARAEALSIAGKIDGVIAQLDHELPPAAPGAPGEQRFQALGVVGVIGPFNFPVHLCNTHVIPTLLVGNTVVLKPSEVTPLAGQRYAELFHDAGFPAGVLNVVHGLGETGAALAAHPGIDGLVFTGSYATGRRIRQATFDQPHKKVSLELGGRNAAVVLDDADLDQAAREILLGALMTAGQRCTATSRVIATKGIADALLSRLVEAFARVEAGDPKDGATLFGPLASVGARDRFVQALAEARAAASVEVLVESVPRSPGAWVTPSLYRVQGDEDHLGEELFGPHVDFEVAADEDDAFRRAARTPYGLSASLFTRREALVDDFADVARVGVVNLNRSTNGASGLLPFGGTGMSGNWAPAGSCAPRLTTFPVAVMSEPHGARVDNPQLTAALAGRAAR